VWPGRFLLGALRSQARETPPCSQVNSQAALESILLHLHDVKNTKRKTEAIPFFYKFGEVGGNILAGNLGSRAFSIPTTFKVLCNIVDNFSESKRKIEKFSDAPQRGFRSYIFSLSAPTP
jgi:hypothetical protein